MFDNNLIYSKDVFIYVLVNGKTVQTTIKEINEDYIITVHDHKVNIKNVWFSKDNCDKYRKAVDTIKNLHYYDLQCRLEEVASDKILQYIKETKNDKKDTLDSSDSSN